jgi:CotH kinase protein/Putative metal-binding motif
MRGIWVALVAVTPWVVATCNAGDDWTAQLSGTAATGGAGPAGGGGGAGDAVGGGGDPTGGAGAGGGGAPATANGCSDLFDPSSVVDFGFDISPEEWAKIDYEFRNVAALKAAGVDAKTYHPIVFHYGAETVPDAMVRLKGQSSWQQTVRDDGAKAKMQFVVSFEEVNGAAKFHGVSKIVFDMPQNDRTFLQERLAFTAMQELFGQAAPCANSARLSINGQYYGLYVVEEHVGGAFIKRVYPDAATGDLFEGGSTPKTNELMPDRARLNAFWDAADIASMAAVVDLEATVAEWAAEAMLNNADGYYGGRHNFFIYDYPGRGYRWLLDDGDATFAWMDRSDAHPIYWWIGRTSQRTAGQHYAIVMADATWRGAYVQALRQVLALWDVTRLQGWIDDWSAQIADAVAQDPHLLFSVEYHREELAEMRQEVADRANYIASFLACQDGSGDASDRDGDGYSWCNDCDDANAAVNPGAPEICGNAIDDNCNSFIDTEDGCPLM